MCVQYIRGYHEYIEGCSVHREETMITSGDIMSTSGMFSTSRDIMMHVGDKLIKAFQFLLKTPMY